MRAKLFHVIAICLAVVGGLHFEAAASEAEPAEAAAPVLLPPRLIEFVEAEFPPEEEEAGVTEASVILLLSISAEGEVVDVEVSTSAGEAFDEAAMAAARQLRFEPATRDGEPIPVRVGFQYDFVLETVVERKTTADFEGRVLDRWTKDPVPGAVVSLDTGEEAVTDEDGAFRFSDLEPGPRVVTIHGDGISMVITEEKLEESHLVEATYHVEPLADDEDDELEIVVSAPRIRKQVLSTEVLADQGRRVPGSQGDVLRVVENLPGVARSAAGSGELVVWGASPQDTRTYVDGIRIPRLYHDGGYRSVIHSDLVRSVELIPGGYGPMYGRGLGGIVAVELKPLDEEIFSGSLEANGIDAAASTVARLSENLHVALAARRSHLDTYVDAIAKPFTDDDVEEFLPIPRFLDGQFRLSYRLSQEERIEAGFLGSTDRIDHSLTNPDPALSVSRTSSVDFFRLYSRYENRAQNGDVTSVVLSWGQDDTLLEELHGGTPIYIQNDADVFGLRASWRGGVSDSVRAEVGLDVDWTFSRASRFGSIGAPAREGDATVFGRPPPDQINADTWEASAGSFAPYALLDIGLFDDKVQIVPGLRLDPYVMQASRSTPRVGELPAIAIAQADIVVEPRISLRYTPFSALTLKAATGIYHQPPLPEDLSAVFGTPTLGLSTAEHWLLGGTVRLTEGLSLELTGFATHSRDLAVRARSESPALARALEQDGEGRSRGLQILLRQNPIGPFFGWVSYSLSKSERKDGPGAAWRPFDWDQRHVLTAVGSFDLGKGFEIGGRFRLATGFPRTEVVGAYYDVARDRYQPLFGERGGIRLPTFASLDLRASKRMELGGTELEFYLDVQNVTNRENPEEFIYDPTYRTRASISGFPILPMLGAKWSW